MTLFQAIFLGIVQGVGEFLPISSSGHLVLAPWLFGFPDPGLTFDVALHLGTLIAILLYFWRDWLVILKLALGQKDQTKSSDYTKNTLWLLVLATIPGALAGYLLEDYAETTFRSPLLIAGTLLVVGFLLYWADTQSQKEKGLTSLTKKDALLVGMSQAVAIIPGVSRSGATITTGLFLGLGRHSAARFSFLLSAPITLGATLLKLPEFFSAPISSVEIVGILTAMLSGYLAIAWLLKFIEKVSYKIFFWYRLLLATVIVATWFVK